MTRPAPRRPRPAALAPRFGEASRLALLLALAAVMFCALLRKAAQDRISMFGYGLFACLFVSYPLMN